ncbi:MAG: cation diffusion facilitator family transporter [Anaerolineales bacterium]
MPKKTRTPSILNPPHPHSHPHDHQHLAGQHAHAGGLWAGLASALHLPGHAHSHAAPGNRDAMFTNRLGTQTLVWSLFLLMATTIIQFIIYAASDSVALLADTIHNLGDALNSVPLLIAFWLARRPATKRYTYGFARAEDLGGLLVVASIIFSAAYILWEVAQKFINPAPIQNSGWVVLAAIIGFLGNEAVAALEIRVGSQIGSEAMVVDGRHARIDGLTSLAVLPAVAGSLLGWPILDPIFGVLIGVAILFITWQAALSIWYRMMDAVDPALSEKVSALILQSPKIKGIDILRLRWVGHSLWIEGRLDVDAATTAAEIEQLLLSLKHELEHQIPNLGEVTLSIGSNEDPSHPEKKP